MRNTFLGLDADAWEQADGLPEWSPMTGGYVSEQDVAKAIASMLHRLDADDAALD